MSEGIVQACDHEIATLEDEINSLEQQLEQPRARLAKVKDVRQQAASIDSDGGGVAETAPAPPAQPTSGVAESGRVTDIVAAIEKIGPPARASAIKAETGLSTRKFKDAVAEAIEAGLVETTGQRAGTRYRLKGNATRPKQGPSHRADAGAPAPILPRRRSHAAEQKAERERQARQESADITERGLALVKAHDGPVRKTELMKEMQDELGVSRFKAQAILTNLGNARKVTSFERADGKYVVFGQTMTQHSGPGEDGPRTDVERKIFDAVGEGATATQVARTSKISGATAILEGLARRGVLRRDPGPNGVIYRRVDLKAAA